MDKNELFEQSKLAAYHMWEATGGANTIRLWYCCEDIASYFEENSIFSEDIVDRVLSLSDSDYSYIFFIRNIAYRIHLYDDNNDGVANWFCAENLVRNSEWVNAVIYMAKAYREMTSEQVKGNIYSDQIKKYYHNI